jgi:hypothetical protein
MLLADMTPPPDSGGQINPFGTPPLVDAGSLDTEPYRGYRVPCDPQAV